MATKPLHDYHAGEESCPWCGQVVIGSHLPALDRKWHVEHYNCYLCGGNLFNKKFKSKNARPFCPEHYQELYCPKCQACDKFIDGGQYMSLNGQPIHTQCFACSVCQTPLAGKKSVVKEGKIFCEHDYHATFGTICVGCGQPITDKILKALDFPWHANCFQCSHCLKPLNGSKFYVKDANVYCPSDYDELFGLKCNLCKEVIKGQYTRLAALNQVLHNHCLKCSVCMIPLGVGEIYADDNSSSIFCHTHYATSDSAVKCEVCNDFIKTTVLRALGGSFHNSCYKCKACPRDPKRSVKGNGLYCDYHGPGAKLADQEPPSPDPRPKQNADSPAVDSDDEAASDEDEAPPSAMIAHPSEFPSAASTPPILGRQTSDPPSYPAPPPPGKVTPSSATPPEKAPPGKPDTSAGQRSSPPPSPPSGMPDADSSDEETSSASGKASRSASTHVRSPSTAQPNSPPPIAEDELPAPPPRVLSEEPTGEDSDVPPVPKILDQEVLVAPETKKKGVVKPPPPHSAAHLPPPVPSDMLPPAPPDEGDEDDVPPTAPARRNKELDSDSDEDDVVPTAPARRNKELDSDSDEESRSGSASLSSSRKSARTKAFKAPPPIRKDTIMPPPLPPAEDEPPPPARSENKALQAPDAADKKLTSPNKRAHGSMMELVTSLGHHKEALSQAEQDRRREEEEEKERVRYAKKLEKEAKKKAEKEKLTANSGQQMTTKKSRVAIKVHAGFLCGYISQGIGVTLEQSGGHYQGGGHARKEIYKLEGADGTQFEFVDYAPKVFEHIRNMYGITTSLYKTSVVDNVVKGGDTGAGKSGMLFFFAQDKRVLLKTLTKQEFVFFRKILPNYHQHLQNNPHTLISRFLGCYRVTVEGQPPLRLIVMNNLFDTGVKIHEKFDLKGSIRNRYVPDSEGEESHGGVLKDLNFKTKMYVGQTQKAALEEQMRSDCKFLTANNIMDQSLLLGVHHGDANTSAKQDDLPVKKQMLTIGLQPNPENKNGGLVSVFQLKSNGVRAFDEPKEGQWSPRTELYFMGIIDILQEFNLKKQAESLVKGIRFNKNAISAISSKKYADRMLDYLLSHMV